VCTFFDVFQFGETLCRLTFLEEDHRNSHKTTDKRGNHKDQNNTLPSEKRTEHCHELYVAESHAALFEKQQSAFVEQNKDTASKNDADQCVEHACHQEAALGIVHAYNRTNEAEEDARFCHFVRDRPVGQIDESNQDETSHKYHINRRSNDKTEAPIYATEQHAGDGLDEWVLPTDGSFTVATTGAED